MLRIRASLRSTVLVTQPSRAAISLSVYPSISLSNEATQECPEHEMGRVHKEHVSPSRVSLVQERLQFGVEKFGLGLDVFGQVFLGGTGITRTR